MTTTTVNDALVELDNVITAANYLLEELKTRKCQLLHRDNLVKDIETVMESENFAREVSRRLTNYYGDSLYREVAFIVMEKIDEDIEAFINSRVEVCNG